MEKPPKASAKLATIPAKRGPSIGSPTGGGNTPPRVNWTASIGTGTMEMELPRKLMANMPIYPNTPQSKLDSQHRHRDNGNGAAQKADGKHAYISVTGQVLNNIPADNKPDRKGNADNYHQNAEPNPPSFKPSTGFQLGTGFAY